MEENSIINEKKIDRFDKYMKFKGLNDNKVTSDLNLSVGTLGKSRKENRDLSGKNIELILNFYLDLNRVWLLTGDGEMLKKPSEISVDTNKDQDIISIPASAWKVIGNQSESLKVKDEQTTLILESLNKKDEQFDEMLKIIKEQNKKSDAEDANFAVKREAQG